MEKDGKEKENNLMIKIKLSLMELIQMGKKLNRLIKKNKKLIKEN